MKTLRIVGVVLGLLFAMVLAGMAYLALSFDEIRVKSELARMVQEKTQRTLKVDGALTLSFWPGLGVRIGHATLSERGSGETFAALDSARFSIRLLPLLARQIALDQVELSGVQATLVRRKDGSLNIDDLLAGEQGPTPKFDIAGIQLADARLGFRDEISGRDMALSKLRLSTGRLANAAQGRLELSARLNGGNPEIDSALRLASNYDYDIDGRRFGLSKLDAGIAGVLAGMAGVELSMGAAAIDIHARGDQQSWEFEFEDLALDANGKAGNGRYEVKLLAPQLLLAADKASAGALSIGAKLAGGRGTLDARLDLSGIEGAPHAMKAARLALLLDAQAGATALQGSISSACVADVSAQTMELPGYSGEIAVANPRLPMKQVRLPISGNLHADFAKQSAQGAARLQFDQSKIRANFHLTGFIPLALDFAIDIDRLDLDRYLPPRREGEKTAQADGGVEQPVPRLAGSPAMSVSALKNLKLQGAVKIGALQYAGVKARNVRLELKAADGKIKLSKPAP